MRFSNGKKTAKIVVESKEYFYNDGYGVKI